MGGKLIRLSRWGRVTHMCVSKLTIIGSDNDLPPEAMLEYYQIVLRNKIRWNCNRNSYNFIQENAFGNVDKKTASALSRSQCVILFELFWCWKRDVSTNRWLAPFIARSSATTVLLRRISGRWLTRGTISTTCASWTLYSLHLRTHTLRKTRVDNRFDHYNDVIMGAMASQITSLTIVYSTWSKKASKLRVTGLWTGDRWIPRTNSQ